MPKGDKNDIAWKIAVGLPFLKPKGNSESCVCVKGVQDLSSVTVDIFFLRSGDDTRVATTHKKMYLLHTRGYNAG